LNWHNVTAAAPHDQVEALEQCFWGLGAVSVTVTDAGDNPLYEPGPGETPMWQAAHVVGLFEDDVETARVEHELTVSGFEFISSALLKDRPWEREWLQHFEPMCFGQRLWVCPTELEVESPNAVVMKLDPGLAFGTGTHATTRLCLEWLDSADLRGKEVLDFGCGSGILGIAACLLGATSVYAIDNDPQALTATLANATNNGVAQRMTISEKAPPAQYDLVIANILAQPLIDLSPVLVQAMRSGADVILSGIMASQGDWVADAYGELSAVKVNNHDGWLLQHYSKVAKEGSR
jgi:ribosomal protein L11 methyltransferase